MKINQIRLSLLFVALCCLFACNPVEEIPGLDEGFIEEAFLEPVDFPIEQVDKEHLTKLMGERDKSCKLFGRIRLLKGESECKFVFELPGGRFISPINVREISDDLENGGYVYFGIEKAEEGPCERGIPAFIICISKPALGREALNTDPVQYIGG